VQNIQDLKKYSLFGGLTDDQIEQILPLMGQEEYGAGISILIEGSANDKIYFITDGTVEVSRGGHVLTQLGVGEEFGEMEVLEIMPSAATIKSLSAVKAKTISNKMLREIYKTDARIFSMMLMNLARDISRRLRRMDELAAQT
jgi:CRP-like cAMP-binding protein